MISEVISLLIKNKRLSAVIYSHSFIFKSPTSVFSPLSFLISPSFQPSFHDPLLLRIKVLIDSPAEGLLVTCAWTSL